jgi:purine-binding chemotaxis protein CheW
MSGLYLFAHINGTSVAIRTDEVEGVVRLRELSPVPAVAGYVAGLAALRSRVLTMIDAAALIRGTKAEWDGQDDEAGFAVVCQISGHSYGIMVEAVEDIQTVESPVLPVCGRIDDVWQPFVQGVIELDGKACFVVSPAAFLDGCAAASVAA